MKTSRFLSIGLALIVILMCLPAPSSAIPVFARKYGFSCTMCHSNIPRLNDFGTRYRQNGYRLPGRENDEKTVLESPPPIAMRTSAGYAYESYSNILGVEEVSQFMLNGLDLLSAGLLGSNIGYFMVYTPEIAPSRHVEGQTGNLEMASVVFSHVGSPWLNVRAGRFEPAYVAFSVKRQLSVTPYEIYDYGAPGNVVISETQAGVELTGNGPGFGRGFRLGYAAGWLNGSGNNDSDDPPSDFYVRATTVIGPGEGQTAGQRIGVMGYIGRARPDLTQFPADSTTAFDAREQFIRLGVDASLNFKMVNLAVQYLFGRDDKRLWGIQESTDLDFWGGFAELSLMPRVDFVAFGRFDMVSTPKEIDRDITRFTGGARYYFVDNLALHLEYSRWVENAPSGDNPTQDSVAARLDFAF
jgi:hypothetical protein